MPFYGTSDQVVGEANCVQNVRLQGVESHVIVGAIAKIRNAADGHFGHNLFVHGLFRDSLTRNL